MTLIFVLLLFTAIFVHPKENHQPDPEHPEMKEEVVRHISAWYMLLPVCFVLLQWLLFTCLMKVDNNREFLMHMANSWMYVWVAMSLDKPGRVKRFYVLHYLMDIMMLIFVILIMVFVFVWWKIFASLFAPIFTGAFLMMFFEVVSHAVLIIFIIIFVMLSFTFVLASIFKLVYYCRFNPHEMEETAEEEVLVMS